MEALKLTVHIGDDGMLEVKTPFKNRDVELLVLLDDKGPEPLLVANPPVKGETTPKYDFSDLVGKLEWKGDFLEEQRKLRDEWE